MSWLTTHFSPVFSHLFGMAKLAVPLVEKPDGTGVNLQGNTSGHPYVADPAIAPSTTYKTYASGAALAADADLVTDGGGPCRAIIVGTAGTLVVVREDDVEITIVANMASASPVLPVTAKLIKSTSTARDILVLW